MRAPKGTKLVGWLVGESMTSDKSWLWNIAVGQLGSQ